MTNSVKLLFLNVRDLSPRIDELLPLIGDGGDLLPPSVPRLFAFVETGRSHRPSIPSYQWSYVLGPDQNGKGGCALLYHNSFAVTPIPTESTTFPNPTVPRNPAYTDSTSILWHVVRPPGPHGFPFLLGIAYVPPQNNAVSYYMERVTSSVSAVCSLPAYSGLPLLLVGDFNAPHPDWTGDSNTIPTTGANHLSHYIDRQHLHVLNSIFIPGQITRPSDALSQPLAQQPAVGAGPQPHSATAGGSVLDLAIASDPTIVLNLHTADRYLFGSDHYPLTVTIDCPLVNPLPPPPCRARTTWRQYENCEAWQALLPSAMRTALLPLLPRFLSLRLSSPLPPGVSAQRRIDKLYSLFESTLIAVCDEVIGRKILSEHRAHWWSQPSVAPLYRQLSAARRAYLDSPIGSPARTVARVAYRSIQSKWRTTVRGAKIIALTELANQINTEDSERRWAAIARTRPSSFSPLNSIPDQHGVLPSDLTSSLDNLCAAFVSEATPPPPPVPVTVRRHNEMLAWTHPTHPTLPPHPSDQWTFTTAQVARQCKQQHIQSAPGPDNILPSLLRHAGRLVHAILSLFFSFSWHHAVLPQEWTQANVMALYKGAAAEARGKPAGSRAQASSYRPISMTSIIIRTFEHLIHRRLTDELEHRNYFHPMQFGFRAGRTTSDAINIVLSTIRHICQQDLSYTDSAGVKGRHRMPCPVIFLDIKKAFDRVWLEDLLHCLYNAGITGKAWRWIRAFLSSRRIRTVQLDTSSHWHPLQYGVPQGAVLSPLLFLIFINPILTRITTQCPNLCPIAFADDGALIPAIIERDPARIAAEQLRQHLPPDAPVLRRFNLQAYLNDVRLTLQLIDDWCAESRVQFGAEKTQMVIFGGAQALHNPTQFAAFQLCRFIIAVVTSYTYLGVILDSKLSWLPHLTKALTAARRESHRITRIVRAATAPHFAAVRSLVLGLLIPSFTYAIAFWGRNCSNQQLRRLNAAITQPLRRFLHLPPTTHQLGVLVDTQCPSTAAWRQRELLLFNNRVSNLPTDHPSRQVHELDLRSHSRHPHLILEAEKHISTSRWAQMIALPQMSYDLRPFILQQAPAGDPITGVLLSPPYHPDPTFSYLHNLDQQPGAERRRHLQQHLTPAKLPLVEQWAAAASSHLTADAIKRLTPWSTHLEWRHPTDPLHQSSAPLLSCLPFPQRSHYLYLDPPDTLGVRARMRARRALTEEHRHRLERTAGSPAASPSCTHPLCAQQPSPPTDSVEHILLHCPRHATNRSQLLLKLRRLTNNRHAVLTLPFLIGEAMNVTTLTKANTPRYIALLSLSGQFLHEIDKQRQRDALRPFEPP